MVRIWNHGESYTLTSNSYDYYCATGADEIPVDDGITGDVRWINLFKDSFPSTTIWTGTLLANRVIQTGNDDIKGAGVTKTASPAFYGCYIMGFSGDSGYRVSMRSAVYGTGETPYKDTNYQVVAVVELLDTVKVMERI